MLEYLLSPEDGLCVNDTLLEQVADMVCTIGVNHPLCHVQVLCLTEKTGHMDACCLLWSTCRSRTSMLCHCSPQRTVPSCTFWGIADPPLPLYLVPWSKWSLCCCNHPNFCPLCEILSLGELCVWPCRQSTRCSKGHRPLPPNDHAWQNQNFGAYIEPKNDHS